MQETLEQPQELIWFWQCNASCCTCTFGSSTTATPHEWTP